MQRRTFLAAVAGLFAGFRLKSDVVPRRQVAALDAAAFGHLTHEHTAVFDNHLRRLWLAEMKRAGVECEVLTEREMVDRIDPEKHHVFRVVTPRLVTDVDEVAPFRQDDEVDKRLCSSFTCQLFERPEYNVGSRRGHVLERLLNLFPLFASGLAKELKNQGPLVCAEASVFIEREAWILKCFAWVTAFKAK